ncbi:MAG: osmoprotectant transport system ATP-binding protein [Halieaceae bacterium]|jgi:osmoprotectant transport system ATP-binding protein
MSILSLESAGKQYSGAAALTDVTLQFKRHQITALIGRSGCGKSTLLKMCNGLVRPDTGTVRVFDEPIAYDGNLPSFRKRIGYAVQGNGLFPHLTAVANISLLAKLEAWPEALIEQRLEELLSLTGLSRSMLDKYPHQLSGGQQQRVGLCRAMMLRPEILLLDEPFAALDPITRKGIHQQVLELHQAEPSTTVLVTHDMREAMLLADTIVVMDNGQVVQQLDKQTLLEANSSSAPEDLLHALLPGEFE